MSTTGHYTRYINQFPGWSDNCDTMYHYIPYPLSKYSQLGSLTVEHSPGNKWSYCELRWTNKGYNYWQWIKEQTEFIGPLRAGGSITLIDYSGDKAIQHVLEKAKKITVDQVIDLIFKHEFYNRSYVDYFRYYQNEVN